VKPHVKRPFGLAQIGRSSEFVTAQGKRYRPPGGSAARTRPSSPELEALMLGDWASYLVYLLFACAIAGSLLFASLAAGTRGRREGRQKSYSFESGVSAGRFEPSNFSINYYLTAMLFIVFDIEIVFLYPVAVLLQQMKTFAFVELVVFVVVLAVGYIYVWRKGALQWK
jgi:NADH-quinone oxidoreductase subunit A